MRAVNCTSCRKKIHEEERDLFLKQQYAVFKDMSTSFAAYAITTVLMTMVKRHRSKEYIQKLYDDMIFVFDTPSIMGKEISMHDNMKMLENEYGIDWDRINIQVESEKEFVSSARKGR